MKVKDLLNQLEMHDPELEVYIFDYDSTSGYTLTTATIVEPVEVNKKQYSLVSYHSDKPNGVLIY